MPNNMDPYAILDHVQVELNALGYYEWLAEFDAPRNLIRIAKGQYEVTIALQSFKTQTTAYLVKLCMAQLYEVWHN